MGNPPNIDSRSNWSYDEWQKDKVKIQELVQWQERTTLEGGKKVWHWEDRKKYTLNDWKLHEAKLKEFVFWQSQDYERRKGFNFRDWQSGSDNVEFKAW